MPPPTKQVVLEELRRLVARQLAKRPTTVSPAACAQMLLASLGEAATDSAISMSVLTAHIRRMIAPDEKVELAKHLPTLCRSLCGCGDVTSDDVRSVIGIELPAIADAAAGSVPDASQVIVHEYSSTRYDGMTERELKHSLVARDIDMALGSAREAELRAIIKSQKRQLGRAAARDKAVREHAYSVMTAVCLRIPGTRLLNEYGGLSLAIRRNRVGHVSCESALLLMAGEDIMGGLRDPKLIPKYEHRATIATRLDFAATQAQFIGYVVAASDGRTCDADVPPRPTKPTAIHVLEIKSDSTVQDAIAREKVLLGLFTLTTLYGGECPLEWIDGPGKEGDKILVADSADIRTATTFPPMQVVRHNTSEELLRLWSSQLRTLQLKHWDDVVNASGAGSGLSGVMWVFLFSLDKGPENQGAFRRIRTRLKGCPFAACWVQWCFFHQVQLIFGYLFNMFDAWGPLPQGKSSLLCTDGIAAEAPDADADAATTWPVKFANGVSRISQIWRSAGVHAALSTIVLRLCGSSDVHSAVFPSLPGRFVRTRWGSLGDIVEKLVLCIDYLPAAFAEVFVRSRKNNKRRRASGIDETDDYELQSLERKISACRMLADNSFRAYLVIANIVMTPLLHFQRSTNKYLKQVSAMVERARLHDKEYLGPTVLSRIVRSAAARTARQLSDLLAADCMVTTWQVVFDYIGAEHMSCAILSMVEATLATICFWWFRFVKVCEDFPLLLLRIVEEQPETCCEVRKNIANLMLGVCPHCVDTNMHDGITPVVLSTYNAEVRSMSIDGKCPRSLHSFMSVIRARLAGHTADVEGMHYTLQVMCNRARNLGIASADQRMALKFGDGARATATSCSDMSSAVDAEIEEARHMHRYAPVVGNDGHDIPQPYLAAGCELHMGRAWRLETAVSLSLSQSVYRQCTIGAKYAYSMQRDMRVSSVWLLPAVFNRVPFVVDAPVKEVSGSSGTEFKLTVPSRARARRLCDEMRPYTRAALDAAGGSLKIQLEVHRCPINWTGMPVGYLNLGLITTIVVSPSTHVRKKHAPSRPGDHADAGVAVIGAGGGADAAGGDAHGEDDQFVLEEALLQQLEEDEYFVAAVGEGGDAGPASPEPDIEPADGEELNELGGDADDALPTDAAIEAQFANHQLTLASVAAQITIRENVATVCGRGNEERIAAEVEASAVSEQQIRPGDISLVRSRVDGSTRFFRWTCFGTKSGRQLSLWPNGQVKAIVPARVPLETGVHCDILITRCPVMMTMRKRADGADKMPQWCQILQRSALSYLWTGPATIDGAEVCVVCSAVSGLGQILAGDLPRCDVEVYRCWRCLCVWHVGCLIAYRGGADGMVPPADATFLCAWCRGD